MDKVFFVLLTQVEIVALLQLNSVQGMHQKSEEKLDKKIYDTLKSNPNKMYKLSGDLPLHGPYQYDFPFMSVQLGPENDLVNIVRALEGLAEASLVKTEFLERQKSIIGDEANFQPEKSRIFRFENDLIVTDTANYQGLSSLDQEIGRLNQEEVLDWPKRLRTPDQIKIEIAVYYPHYFECLLHLIGLNRDEFVNSIMQTANFDASGGKSGSDFFKS